MSWAEKVVQIGAFSASVAGSIYERYTLSKLNLSVYTNIIYFAYLAAGALFFNF
jgi:hypothetical protein